MRRLSKISLLFLAILAVVSLPPADAAASEKRLALVIGNASYKAKALATPVNDAALIARSLQESGFDVIGARDLDGDLLRQTFRDFTDRVTSAGPDAVAVVYFAGYGLQFEGQNYLVPTDAVLGGVSDLPGRALPLSEQMHALAALHLKATFIILDMARTGPVDLPNLAGGLAWVEPEANTLIAFNAAPDTVAPEAEEAYGPYAKALAEMIREGNLTPAKMFDRIRLRVNESTSGAQVPWDASNIETKFKFFERTSSAPSRADSPEHTASMRSQSMRSLGAHDAYMIALMRDTFDAYADFLADYWHDPMTQRVRALLAARREAITWRRTCQANVPEAYWSYLERYPSGPHLADTRRLLTHLNATIEPPSKFARVDYDVPPPLPDELDYVDRTKLVLNDPTFRFEKPQPSPVYFLEPLPPEFLDLTPPTVPSAAYLLPMPRLRLLPDYVRVPADVVAPPNTPVKSSNEIKPDAQAASLSKSSPRSADATKDLADYVRLPPSVAAKATLINNQKRPPAAANQMVSEAIKTPLAPPTLTVSPTLREAANEKKSMNPGIELATSTTELEAPIPAPTTRAPPSSDVPWGAWSSDMLLWRATGRGPPPILRQVATAPSQTSLSPRTPGSTMPSPETTGSIPSSITQSGTLAPPSTGALLGAWSSDMLLWRATGRSLQPIPQSVALARLRTGLSPETPGSTMPSIETTGSIPASTPQSETLAPPSSGALLGAWSGDMLLWRATGRSPQPIPRSVALARSRTDFWPRTPDSTMPSAEINGHIAASIPRSVALAPRSTDVLVGAWSTDMLLWRATRRNQTPQSEALARLRTGFSRRMPGSTVPSPPTTGRIPGSISRSVTHAPRPIGQRSKPIANVASTSSQ
jgi:uncharacterized caspase-like protein